MPEPIPTAAEIAALDGPELDALAALAMGWRHCGGDRWDMPEPRFRYAGSLHGDGFTPRQDANHAIELAEKVFNGSGYVVTFWASAPDDQRYVAQDAMTNECEGIAKGLALALTRAACIAWAEREAQR